MKQQIITLYEYLYRITSDNKKFKCNPKGRDIKIIDNFTDKLTPSHGEDWLFNFMTYQFSRYADQDTQFGKGKIMLGWVLGDKAIDKFKNASSEELYYANKFVEENGIKNPFKTQQDIDMSEYRHRERRRFYHTDEGLVHCKLNGGLYDPNHKDCIFCKYKEYCK